MSSGQHTLPRSTWLLLACLTLGWGFNWPIMKIALAQMPLWSFRSACVIGGAAGMFLIAWAGGRRLLPPPAHWGRLAGTSVFNVALWNLCIAYGLTYLPAGRSVILAYTMPLWVVLLSRLLLDEPLTHRRLAGVALGLIAMGLLIGSELAVLRAAPVGAALVLAAALSWAVGTVLIKRCPTDLPTTSFTAWQLLIGGAPIAIGALVLEQARWQPIPWPAAFAIVYNIGVAFVFCYWAWYKIVSRTSAGVSALGSLMIPVVGVFSSMLLLGERPSWHEYAALVLVMAAIATVVIPKKQDVGRGT
jgi:drug/metabolite transporter (DMT)-like permease